jgi:hypothetical protein
LALQLLERSLHALAQEGPVILERHHRRTGLVGIGWAHRLPIQVGNQHHVTVRRHRPGDFLGPRAYPHPIRCHQQPRARALLICIEGQAAFIGLAIELVHHRTNRNLTHD